MSTKFKSLILVASALFFLIETPALSVEIKGEVTLSDNGKMVPAELKTTGNNFQGPANGFFQYSENGRKIVITVTYLKTDGEYAWFAGKCTGDGVDYTGRWFFAAVHDGGTPGRLVDHLWWEWISDSDNARSIAESKVRNMRVPSERKKIQSGDIKISD
jgi:hypothetical protein